MTRVAMSAHCLSRFIITDKLLKFNSRRLEFSFSHAYEVIIMRYDAEKEKKPRHLTPKLFSNEMSIFYTCYTCTYLLFTSNRVYLPNIRKVVPFFLIKRYQNFFPPLFSYVKIGNHLRLTYTSMRTAFLRNKNEVEGYVCLDGGRGWFFFFRDDRHADRRERVGPLSERNRTCKKGRFRVQWYACTRVRISYLEEQKENEREQMEHADTRRKNAKKLAIVRVCFERNGREKMYGRGILFFFFSIPRHIFVCTTNSQ